MEEDTKTTISTHTNSEHGSVWSYAVGFIASLILTIIPYWLVTQQILIGTTLLLVILGFAVLQMLIQMFFFLHLGRGPKPLYNVAFFVGTAGAITIIVGASILIMNNLYRNMSPEEYTTRLSQDENISQIDGQSTGACQENRDNNASHMVMAMDGTMSPKHIEAKRCDTLVFMSHDNANHTFAFGTPERTESYGGMFEVSITPARSKTITLNQTGSFHFYDSSNHTLAATFTVNE